MYQLLVIFIYSISQYVCSNCLSLQHRGIQTVHRYFWNELICILSIVYLQQKFSTNSSSMFIDILLALLICASSGSQRKHQHLSMLGEFRIFFRYEKRRKVSALRRKSRIRNIFIQFLCGKFVFVFVFACDVNLNVPIYILIVFSLFRTCADCYQFQNQLSWLKLHCPFQPKM